MARTKAKIKNITPSVNKVENNKNVTSLVRSRPNVASIAPAMFELSDAMLTTIQQTAIKYYLDLVTPIVSVFYSQLEGLIPSGDDVADSEQLNESILKKLNVLIQTPEFQKEYKQTARSIALFLKLAMNEFLEVFDDEGDILVRRIGDSAKKIAVNVSATAYDTVQDFLSVIPGPDAAIAVFNLVTSGITNGAQIMLSGIEIFGHIIELSEKVTGNTIGPAGDTIANVQNLLQMVSNPSQGMVPVINDATNTLNTYNAANSVAPHVAETTDRVDAFNKEAPIVATPEPRASPKPPAPPLTSYPVAKPSKFEHVKPVKGGRKKRKTTRKRKARKSNKKINNKRKRKATRKRKTKRNKNRKK